MQIFLTGFMGAGKSTVGRLLAARLGCGFVDLDRRIEERCGLDVPVIFRRHGEAYFRRLEHEALASLPPEQAVVATGGGVPTVAANLALMRERGVSVWLDPPVETLLGRLGAPAGERPLYRDGWQAAALYRRRLPGYRRSDLRVEVGPHEQPEEVAARLEALLAERCAT